MTQHCAAPAPPAPVDTSPWPRALCQYPLDDAALAEAYERSAPEHRACVKHCLALLHSLWGEECEECTRVRTNAALGFCVTQASRPAPWALFAVSAAYAAPTRLAAALMPALLARVPHVAVLCVGGMPSASTRLTLELSGVQHIFCLEEEAARAAVCELCSPCASRQAQGCVALLHQGELESLARAVAHLSLPLWEEKAPPCIEDATGGKLVAFCHPDALPPAAPHHCDAVFDQPAKEGAHALCPPQAAPRPSMLSAPLRVTAGMEGFWLHPGLTPDFFRRHSTCMTPYTGEDAWART